MLPMNCKLLLPILCLHNIRVEYRDYSAQFDFVVITNKCIFVLETKTMLGDIIIDSYGNFTRVLKLQRWSL